MIVEQITITKVVSRNFIQDFIVKLQNLVGANLTSYEIMAKTGVDQITEELKEKKIKLKWYRYQISQLANGALIIMLYGEFEK